MKGQKGQTLIEVLAALGVAVAVVSAITVAALSSLQNVGFSKNQSLATAYAQEGMEIVRSLRGSNWSTFKELSGSYCLDKNKTSLSEKSKKDTAVISGCKSVGTSTSTSTSQNVDVFARQVDIEQNSCGCGSSIRDGINIRKVTLSVSWSDSKCGTLPTPTPEPESRSRSLSVAGVSNCSSLGTSRPDRSFCHRVQLVSCLSDFNIAPAP